MEGVTIKRMTFPVKSIARQYGDVVMFYLQNAITAVFNGIAEALAIRLKCLTFKVNTFPIITQEPSVPGK